LLATAVFLGFSAGTSIPSVRSQVQQALRAVDIAIDTVG
jgi:hypothetical protein